MATRERLRELLTCDRSAARSFLAAHDGDPERVDRAEGPLSALVDLPSTVVSSLSAVRGENLRLLQGPDSERAAVDALSEAVEIWEPVTVELWNYRADGSDETKVRTNSRCRSAVRPW
ncbi:hypothetical protein BRC96_08455 [Halobacteriales archaeon QS_6_64_34]|nr:MAG: hypothetical protein BRC96_08455 [Halobacteriales archaeon QS_6_64_34]